MEYNRAGLLMTLLKVGIIAMAADTLSLCSHAHITSVDQSEGSCRANNPQQCWNGSGKERRILNVPLHLVIDTKPLVYWRHRDLHLFTVAPPSLSFVFFSSASSASLPQSSRFVAGLHEVDITPPCCYDIDQPPFPPFSLHSPLH